MITLDQAKEVVEKKHVNRTVESVYEFSKDMYLLVAPLKEGGSYDPFFLVGKDGSGPAPIVPAMNFKAFKECMSKQPLKIYTKQ